MTEVRDWQKDMKLVEDFKFAQTLVNGIQPMFHGQFAPSEPIQYALEYWLQQYVAEKERADELEKTWIQTTAALVNAEAQEKKLREAIESLIDDGLLMIPDGENRAMDLLSSLYPLDKEGEA